MDFYSITYLGFIIENQIKYDITKEINHQNFTNCLFIFGLQSILSFLVGMQIFEQGFSFTLGTFSIFVTRYIVAIMLHLQICCEIRQAIGFTKYLAENADKFSARLAPFFIAQMQILGAIFTELMNLCLICGQNDIMSCIMNFIALGCISQIDNFYA